MTGIPGRNARLICKIYAFAINGTNSFSVANNLLTISGVASVAIKDISVNGVSGLTTYYLLLPRSTMRLVTGNTSPAVQVGSVHITPMGGNPAADAMTIFSFQSNGQD